MDKEYIVHKNERLDKYLTLELKTSRNQVEKYIKQGLVYIDGKKCIKPSKQLNLDQMICISEIEMITQPTKYSNTILEKLNVEIFYEDENFLVVLKPDGLVVHPAPSVNEPTLVDWLKYKNIRLSTLSGEERHGIVHRIDKGTSGLLVVAKTNEAHQNLSKQLENKTMGRYYIAFIDVPLKGDTVVNKAIGRNPKNRLKMGCINGIREAKTAFKKLVVSKNKDFSMELIAAKLFTGRTHQIRAHLETLQRHILGDSLYGFKSKNTKIERIFLHAYCLYLDDPITNERKHFISPLPDAYKKIIKKYFEEEIVYEKIDEKYIVNCFDNIDKWMQS